MSAPARLELDDVTDGSGQPPARIEGFDGLEFVDLGVVCPDVEPLESMQGWPSSTCQRRAIGVGLGFVVELVLPVESDLHDVAADIRVGTLDDLRDAIGDVDGVDQLGAPPIEVPTEDPAPPPDTPFCNAWSDVLELARAGSSPYDPALIDAMGLAADVAPAELAVQIRDLAALWSTAPAEATPSQESATRMLNVINAASAECPGIQDWIEE
jgi:hypothetical protein